MHKIKHIGNTIVELLTNTYANHASMLDLGCPSYPHVAGLNQHVTEEEARLKQKHYFISFNTITSWEQIFCPLGDKHGASSPNSTWYNVGNSSLHISS